MINYLRVVYYLHNMMKRAYWAREQLMKYQDKKLREIVEYAYDRVPFYHKKFRETGIKPDDIKTAKDLNKLPIIRKDEIKKNLNRIVSEEFKIDNLKIHRTSGSTGRPLHFYITGAEDEFRKAKHLRANISCGQKARDKWVVITSPFHFGGVTNLQRTLGVYVPTSLSVFDDAAVQFSIIEKLRPDVLDGYSSSLLLLAKEVEKRGIKTIKPKFVIGGAELIGDSSRRFIEKVFNAPFYDQYASAEFERMAFQCPEKVGYHIDSDSIVMQFVDKNGEEVSLGERGEIVCTSLFNRAMPFIRYAVGDVGAASEEKDCPCGRTLPLMKMVEGRKDSLLLLPEGRVLSPIPFISAMLMFRLFNHIDQFRIIQKKTNLFEFRIKTINDSFDKKILEKELVQHFQRALNIDTNEVTFEVIYVKEFPLDKSGKFMAVISELKQNLI